MNGMVIPNPHNFARNCAKQLLQKGNYLDASQRASIRMNHQLEMFFAMIRNKHCAKQIQSLMMVQTGSHHRCLPTRRPSTLEWRHKREAAFIFKCQRGLQLTPLFLSLARYIFSSVLWFPRLSEMPVAEDAGCSSQSVS